MTMSNRAAGMMGLAATSLFAAALFYFASLIPGYTHATTAISEFGAIGAPYRHAWNLLGFLLPGIFMSFHGWGVGAARADPIAGFLFAMAGLSFAATAIPADMSNYLAPTTTAHIAASLGVFAFWLLASLKLAFGRDLLARITVWSLWLALAAGAIRFSGFVYPGTGQRLAFAAFFIWVAATSIALIVSAKAGERLQGIESKLR